MTNIMIETCDETNNNVGNCLRITSNDEYDININRRSRVLKFSDDLTLMAIEFFSSAQFLIFCISILLFLNARRIVKSTSIFYSGGVLIGVFSSVIIVAFFLQRLLPKRIFPFYLGCWPISFYVYYQAWQNFGSLIKNYHMYIAAYVVVVCLISFGVCYRFGPPSDIRSLNLMKWFLQICSIIGVYYSFANKTLSIIIVFLLVTGQFWLKFYKKITKIFGNVFNFIINKIFGPKARPLLTISEYEREGREYTRKELENLKLFCQKSPSTKNWKIISRLSDPKRMASFINEESNHVLSNESTLHAAITWPENYEYVNDFSDSDFETVPQYTSYGYPTETSSLNSSQKIPYQNIMNSSLQCTNPFSKAKLLNKPFLKDTLSSSEQTNKRKNYLNKSYNDLVSDDDDL